MSKILILFVFHIYNDRVRYFINNSIFFNENIDFVIISNGVKNVSYPPYVKFFYRQNIGYDFGGWSDALLTNNLYKNYDKFIFVNSSVTGPYLPKSYKHLWPYYYLNRLDKNNVKLVGSTINTMSNPITQSHVQSYIFAMDKTTLEYLINCNIFTKHNYCKTFLEAIMNKEILMSRKIIERGWNIGSMMKIYNGVDFTFKSMRPAQYRFKFLGDVMNSLHRGKSWTAYQLIFIKGNRPGLNFFPDTILMNIKYNIIKKNRMIKNRNKFRYRKIRFHK